MKNRDHLKLVAENAHIQRETAGHYVVMAQKGLGTPESPKVWTQVTEPLPRAAAVRQQMRQWAMVRPARCVPVTIAIEQSA
jgi:hypothetical protein